MYKKMQFKATQQYFHLMSEREWSARSILFKKKTKFSRKITFQM